MSIETAYDVLPVAGLETEPATPQGILSIRLASSRTRRMNAERIGIRPAALTAADITSLGVVVDKRSAEVIDLVVIIACTSGSSEPGDAPIRDVSPSVDADAGDKPALPLVGDPISRLGGARAFGTPGVVLNCSSGVSFD